MTTENTNTDTAVVIPPRVMAERFVSENLSAVIAEELAKQYEEIAELKLYKQRLYDDKAEFQSRWATLHDKVEEFLKSHIAEDDSASVSELKELADSLGFELTKKVEVTFTVEVTATLTVPLDFDDEEDIQDNDFNIDITYEGNHDDVECDEVDWTLNHFMSDEK